MCVAAIAWDAHPDWALVVAGNRDEFHLRPTRQLSRWEDGSGIIAGKDLSGGGTWQGLTEGGNFTLVTNYRVPEGPQPNRPSRGILVTDLLQGAKIDALEDSIAAMNPFNLLTLSHKNSDNRNCAELSFLTNHPRIEKRTLTSGIYGISNGSFDTPWPKSSKLVSALESWLNEYGSLSKTDKSPRTASLNLEPLFNALGDSARLPSQDGQSSPEPHLSSIFINNAVYGTRCSTIVAVTREGQGIVAERSFDPKGAITQKISIEFEWPQIR